jgi:uncharacterized protein (TIGR03546 family)
MPVLQIIAKLFKILRSEASPNQIAWGFSLGMIIGLTPFWTVHNMVLIFLIAILKVNIGMALFSFALFSGVAWLLDPVFHNFGYYLLVDVTALHSLWTTLYSLPVIALSRYNNTVVMGSLVVSLLLVIPVFPFARYFVIFYRKKIDPMVQRIKFFQIIKGSKVYQLYEKIKGIGE